MFQLFSVENSKQILKDTHSDGWRGEVDECKKQILEVAKERFWSIQTAATASIAPGLFNSESFKNDDEADDNAMSSMITTACLVVAADELMQAEDLFIPVKEKP